MTPIEAYGVYLLIGACGALLLWAKGYYQIINATGALFVALCVSIWPFVVGLYVWDKRR